MTTLLPDVLGHALGANYRLDRELTGGGMARVFVARDVALGRDVVVKVLAPELAAGLNVERFMREIRLAASLQHPHVVPVLAAGDANGTPFYTMPFVSGESLRTRLAHGPLAIPEAVRVLAGVARALACAHRQNIVHRDIKPDNVLLVDGVAVVTDFGVAKALVAASTDPMPDGAALWTTLTQRGMAVGTPVYMAPEQAAGDPAIDHRADIYSWGMLAYELLAGAAPFADRTLHDTLVAQFVEEPAPIATRRADVPPALGALIERCLVKDPAARPQSADLLLNVLDGEPVGPGAGIRAVRRDAPQLPSVAVLPFDNLSGLPDSDFFAEGVTDEVIGALAQLGTVRVAGRSSSFAFRGTRPPIAELARRLRVAHVVDGSVRRAGSRVRIAVQLISAADGLTLWSTRFDRELLDVFELQDEIAQAVASALQARLLAPLNGGAPTVPDEAPRARPTESAEAYECYLRGRHFWHQRATGAPAAIEYFARAVALDPTFAQAHAGVADVHLTFGTFHMRPSRGEYPLALAAAERALTLGPDAGEAHASRGGIALFFEHDYARAQHHLERALALNPGYVIAMQWLGGLHLAQRRVPEMRRLMARALEMEPLAAGPHGHFGTLVGLAGDAAEAEALVRRAAELDPSYAFADFQYAILAMQAGRASEGIEPAERFHAATRGGALAVATRAAVYAMAGRATEAQRDVVALLGRGPGAAVPHAHVAMAYVALGDRARAYDQLEAALVDPDLTLPYIGAFAGFAPLRGQPRFEAILRRLGLPPSA